MIELRRVSKEYRAASRGAVTRAVEDVTLTLEEAQFTCVVGRSGCGKTTLLNLIAGFETPTTGQIYLDDKPVTGPGSDRMVVFQQAVLYPWLDVRHNVALGMRLAAGRRGVDWGRVQEFIEIVGLEKFERHYPHQLSGGMQQRVAIARSLVMGPRVLLMDEPFGALDAQTRHAMQEFLLRLWEDHRSTVMFVTHDVEEAILLADKVVIMSPRPGRISEVIDVSLDRPRDASVAVSREFMDLKMKALEGVHTS
jgi:NitT/TauT family transport system ATP-binding protein